MTLTIGQLDVGIASYHGQEQTSEYQPISIRLAKEIMVRAEVASGRKIQLGLLIVLLVLAVTVAVVIAIVYNTDDGNEDTTSTLSIEKTHSVTTTGGDLIGRRVQTTTISGQTKQVYEFINIPYAHPPVRELRWQRPLACDKKSPCWSGQYQANISRTISCPQMLISGATFTPLGQEDCLHLTVRSPSLSGRRPVLVWIHGGYLMQGWGNRFGYQVDNELALDMDVVSVNINYRLSALGFLSVQEMWRNEDPSSYGNYGFFDQVLALTWIKDNVINFGGNPDSVTIMGESAGGTSLLALASTPLANGLFHRGIAVTPMPQWGNDYKQAAIRNLQSFFPILASLEQCNISTFDERKECLKNAHVHNLTRASLEQFIPFLHVAAAFPSPGLVPVMGQAIIDSVLVRKNPNYLSCANMETASTIPILVGNMAQETNAFSTTGYKEHEWTKMRDDLDSNLLKFNISDTDDVLAMYPNITSSNETNPPQRIFDQMISDIRCTCPTNIAAQKMAESSQHAIYRFYISHRPSAAVNGATEAYHSWGTEALFNFQFARSSYNFTASKHDFELRDKLRSVFKDFVHNSTVPDGWKPYPEHTYIVSNDAANSNIIHGAVQKRQCDYWNNIGFDQFGWRN